MLQILVISGPEDHKYVATVWLSWTYLLVRRKSTNTIIADSEQGFGFIRMIMKIKLNLECLNK
jgi:hypothetical protein